MFPVGARVLRVIIPDTHGAKIDARASRAFLDDLKYIDPQEIVGLGDHTDADGIFSLHAPNSLRDRAYNYADDIAAANRFWDEVQKRAKRAAVHVLEGNHDSHVERWAVRALGDTRFATEFTMRFAPHIECRFKERGFHFYRMHDRHMGIAVPGTIKLGKCFFTHGSRAGKYATSAMLDDFGACVVHGHTHRAQAFMRRTVHAGEIGAWCPGTLSELQPTYLHTAVSTWTHGYALQAVAKSGRFVHINVPIAAGESLLRPLVKLMRP
jgi:predicted phosphodiesterase